MKRKTQSRIDIRLLPGADDDLIRWLREMDFADLRYGEKSERIKSIFRLGLQAQQGGAATPTTSAAIDIDALSDALLPQIRKVVDAALAGAGGMVLAGPPRQEEDPDAEFLAVLDAELFLPEDEDD